VSSCYDSSTTWGFVVGCLESEICELPGVLLVAGAKRLSSGVRRALSVEACAVQVLTPEQPLEAVSGLHNLEVVVCEHLSPDDLVKWCESVRELPNRPALLVVSSQPQLQVRAFQAGADDCISDTSDASAIVERVLVNARRVRSVRASCSSPRVLRTRAGTLAVLLGPLVALDGVPLDLPRVQIRLLRTLMETSRPVSVGALASSVWPRELVAVHTVHTQIALLRSRLESLGIKVDHIRGAGYVLSTLH